MRSTVIGAGSWGTALGATLASGGNQVTLWDVDEGPLRSIQAGRGNERYLPGIPLPDNLGADPDLESALSGAELVVLVVPSQAMREVATRVVDLVSSDALFCSATKGIELGSLMMMSEVLEEVFPEDRHGRLTFLSGPSFAVEVARGQPTAVTIASKDLGAAEQVQQAFHTPTFRPYSTDDVPGVEIGGCVKNVVAIATGLADGLGFEMNARAALVTRGLAEITRLGVALGARPLTLAGLAGVGDLLLTCSSEKSRNYRVGLGLGQGKTIEQIQTALGQTAEGVVNAQSVYDLSARVQVDMPICNAVHALLYDGLTPRDIIGRLLDRDLKREM